MRKVTSCMVMAAALTLAAPPAAAAALDCSAAVEVELGQAYDGDNTGLPDNVSMYACSDWDESGGEVVYELVLDDPGVCYEVTGTLSDLIGDLDVYFLGSCDEEDCLTYGNTYFTSDCLEEGTYYIVVDGYGGAEGPFTLTVTCVECTCPLPCPDEQNYMPFSEDFERSDCFPPAGWTIVNGGDDPAGETWDWSDYNQCEGVGTANCYWGASGEFQDEWFITPIIYMEGATDIVITFQHLTTTWSYCTDPKEVLISTTDTDVGSFTAVWTYDCLQPDPVCETPVEIEVGDPYLPADHIYVAWRYMGTWAESYNVDNILIEEASTPVEETSWGTIKALYR